MPPSPAASHPRPSPGRWPSRATSPPAARSSGWAARARRRFDPGPDPLRRARRLAARRGVRDSLTPPSGPPAPWPATSDGGPAGRRDLVRLALRQPVERLADRRRRASCSAHRALRRWRSPRRAARGSSGCVPSRPDLPPSAGSARPRCRTARTLRGLAAQPAPVRGAAQLSRSSRAGCSSASPARGGQRVQADHEVEAAPGEQVEVRRRAHAAVHVAAAADLHRPVEAGDRAGRGHGVGHVGRRERRRGRRGRACRSRSRRPRPRSSGGRPSGPAPRGGRCPSASRWRRARRAASRPRAGAACGAAGSERARPPSAASPGPITGQPAVEPERGAAGAVGLGRGLPVGPGRGPSKVSPARVGDHEPGRHPGGHERADHRARPRCRR